MSDRIATLARALRPVPGGWLTVLPPDAWPDVRADLETRQGEFIAFAVPPGMVVVVSDARPQTGHTQCETGASLSEALTALGTSAIGKIEMSEALAKTICQTPTA
jgi:hypothetical protein